jgi:hypothetical protein
MSPDLVRADPKDVRKLANALQQYEQKLLEISKQAQSAIDRANWHDGQKDKFAARYKDFHKQTNKFAGEQLQQFVKQLNALATDLERAQSHRF